jgi:hypothetical protein
MAMYSSWLDRLARSADGGNRMMLSLPAGVFSKVSSSEVRSRRDSRSKTGAASPRARLCLGIGDGSIHRQ